MNFLSSRSTLSLLIITFFALISYAILIPLLGFYNDDFFITYVAHFFGPEGVLKSTAVDRPLHGYIVNLLYYTLGIRDQVFFWHVYTFLIRLFGAYLLYFSLKKIWPQKLSTVTIITLFFLVYPGFLQQSLPFGFGIWITNLTVWILSLSFTIWATLAKTKFNFFALTVTAILLQVFSLLLLEFFIGLEILRILLVIYLLYFKNIGGIKLSLKTIKTAINYLQFWLPYIISALCFILWRIFIFRSARDVTDISWVTQNFYTNPLWIIQLPLELIHSFIQTVVLSFLIPISINFLRVPLEKSMISLSLGIISGLILYFYFKNMKKSEYDKHPDITETQKISKSMLIIGVTSIFAALIPIILSGRFVRVYLVYDRYTISSMVSVGLIITGFLLYKFNIRIAQWIIIILISLSVSSQLMNGFYRESNWNQQKNIWWQIYWRAPRIQNNATLILDFPKLTTNNISANLINKVQWYRIYWVDYQIWTSGNLFLNYSNPPKNHLTGDFLEDEEVINKIKNQSIEPAGEMVKLYNLDTFSTKDFRNTVIIYTPSENSCLWVLDKERVELPENSDNILESNIIYSDPNKLAQTGTPTVVPKTIFGAEPPLNWCYFYQKASLARQFQNWTELSRLTNKVFEEKFKPKDNNEWLPFIEGLIVTKQDKKVSYLLEMINKNGGSSDRFKKNICQMFERLHAGDFRRAHCIN